MPYAPLQSSIPGSDPAADAEAQQNLSCSPRSMYSLGVLVGIFLSGLIVPYPDESKLGMDNLREHALENIRSKLTPSNIVQELFTLFAAKCALNEVFS